MGGFTGLRESVQPHDGRPAPARVTLRSDIARERTEPERRAVDDGGHSLREWARCGLPDVVVCPGSRSTPLSLAAAARPGSLHVRLDERSAGFFALGRALATSRPVVIVVTSGTAAAELHAAVAEADLAGVPLVVVTADRPPELHGVGAAQTIDQRHLYGPMVRRFEEPGVARDEARSTWRPLAADCGTRPAAGQ